MRPIVTGMITSFRKHTTPSVTGQTMVEYGLLVALIAVIVIVALLFLGPIVRDLFDNIGTIIEGT